MQRWDDATLARRLAELGVGLFHPAPVVRAPSERELADVIDGLATSEDARLVASLPCVFVLHHRASPPAVRHVVAARTADGDSEAVARIGLAWRLARAFCVQWEPDLVRLLGAAPVLPPLPCEPTDLPAPDADHGERCPAVAREIHEDDPGGNPVTDLVDLFTKWLRQTELERPPSVRGEVGHA